MSLTCGVSLQRSARIIAIVDIVYCFFSVIVRTAVAVVQAAYSVQIPTNQTDNSRYRYHHDNDNNASTKSQANLQFKLLPENATQTLPPESTLPEYFATNTSHYSKIPEGPEPEEFQFEIANVFTFLIILMVGVVLYIIFELWMCRLLLGASKNLDKENCKRWWWYRLTMTMVLLFLCITLTLIINRGWFSWLLELVVFYRVYSLIVIHQFKNEIGATSSRVQIRNSPQ